MTEIERAEVQSKIIEALRKLIPSEEQKPLCEMWIETGIGAVMAYVDALTSDFDVNWRTPLGRNNVRKELDEIVTIYKKLIGKMNRVHQPTHEILSSIGIGPFFERSRCENLLNKISEVDISSLPINPGRGESNMVESNISVRLAIIFANITGNHPGRSVDVDTGKEYGSFLQLLQEAFEILGINASPAVQAREAADAYTSLMEERGGT